MSFRMASDGSNLIFTKKGNLVGLSTGSDHCSEHEWGIVKLMDSLCAAFESVDEAAKRMRSKNSSIIKKHLEMIMGGFKYPEIIESKRIQKDNSRIFFVEEETSGMSCGWLFYHPEIDSADDLYKIAIQFPKTIDGKTKEMVSAWCDYGFIIGVNGRRNIKALRNFHAAMREGHVVFAGKWLNRDPMHLSGIVLADVRYMSDKDKANIQSAQEKQNSQIRLKAYSDVPELYSMIRESAPNCKCHLSPRWKDETETDILYWLNPHHGTQAEFGGPYPKEAIVDWIVANGSYKLARD